MSEKIENAAGTVNTGNTNASANTNTESSTGKKTNTVGAGLKSTAPPDVLVQMTEASHSHAAGKYSDARYPIQQALVGIEIQIGHQVLASLPARVNVLA